MKINFRSTLARHVGGSVFGFAVCALIALPLTGAGRSKNPTSKIFVSDMTGVSQVDFGDKIVQLEKKSVFSAQGTTIETKANSTNALVYSNGSGIFLAENTRIQLRRFAQEPFAPNRTDMETEPSISQTEAFIARGSVSLCTSKMVAGSTMTYQTPLASVNVRGKRMVIQSGDDETKVSMLEGDCSVRGGDRDVGGHTVRAGEQAIVRRGPLGEANPVEIRKIPAAERDALEESASMGCQARQTVYFEVRDRQSRADGGENPFDDSDAARTAPLDIAAAPGNTGTILNPPVQLEIVPIAIVPGNLPVNFTVSPSRLQ